MLSIMQYDALDRSSSSLLLQRLTEAQRRGWEAVSLYDSNGLLQWLPCWALTCALAEREEQESRSSR